MKLKIINYSAVLFALLAFTLPSCKKYEDGPALSLRSKKERISNTWKIEQAMENGNDVTSSFDQYELQLLNNNRANLAAIYTWNNFTFEYETSGTWDLMNNNEDLKLDFEDDDADNTYQILRLTEDELWLREKGDDLELHLIPR